MDKFLWLPIALFALVLAHFLRPPKIRVIVSLPNAFAFVLGVGVVALATNKLCAALDVGRKSAVVYEERHLPQGIKDAPILLLIGSSYTRNGINPDIVNAIWAKEGIQTRLMTRAAGGASRLEQWIFVEDVARLLGRMPKQVMFEIHPYWDRAPLYGLKNPMSGRAINQITGSTLKWALLSVYHEDDFRIHKSSYPKGGAALAEITKHYLAGQVNYALSQNLARDLSTKTRGSFVPLRSRKDTADPERIAKKLGLLERELQRNAKPMLKSVWLEKYFADVASRIEAAGGSLIGFYATPSSLPMTWRYARSFCAWQSQAYCLDANTPDMPEAYPVSFWYDETHLLINGAEQYSRWLAHRLIKDGVVK